MNNDKFSGFTINIEEEKPTQQVPKPSIVETPNTEQIVSNKKPVNDYISLIQSNKYIIAAIALGVILLLLILSPKKLQVEDMNLYLGYNTVPTYTAEKLDSAQIDSISYKFDKDGVITVSNENMLSTETAGETVNAKIIVKTGIKKWKGNFVITTSYKSAEFKNGQTPIKPKSGSATLSIKNGEETQSCYLYFKSKEKGKLFSILLTGNGKYKHKVPAGTYAVYVAYGNEEPVWYGEKYIFGKESASYYQVAKNVKIPKDGKLSLTVTNSTDGKLKLNSLTYDEFPHE